MNSNRKEKMTLESMDREKMHGQFTREMPETVDKDNTWEWTRKGDLNVESGALIFAAHKKG